MSLALALLSASCAASPERPAKRPGCILEVEKLTPPEKTRMGANSTLEATLRFRIEGFDSSPERYQLIVLFAGERAGSFRSRIEESADPSIILERGAGTVTLRYPLRAVAEAPGLARPVQAIFTILERSEEETDPPHYRSLCRSEAFTYDLPPAPPEADTCQPAVDEELGETPESH